MAVPEATDFAHVVSVDRRRGLCSPTLGEKALSELNAAWRATPWYRDPWSFAKFRGAALDVMFRGAPAGLAFIGRGVRIEPPPPFTDPFEPIEFGSGDDQFDVLSGPTPTREERVARFAKWIIGIIGAAVVVSLGVGWLVGGDDRIAAAMLFGALAIAAVVTVVALLGGLGGKWFLLPGAIAVVRARGEPRARLQLYTRRDSCAVLRYVSTGKTVVLMLELWSTRGRPARRAVTEREAMAFLAAWQSPLPPPERDRLADIMAA
ncbi:MAG: hypothetical protein AB7Q17_06960 [Phycisphaerae bacterium]